MGPKMKTAAAIAKRRSQYRDRDTDSLPHIQDARADGAKNAGQIAHILNAKGVSGPTNDTWTESAVLRCLRRLKAMGLDAGSPSPHRARVMKTIRKGGTGMKSLFRSSRLAVALTARHDVKI
jgi:hypothetical protein